MPARIGITQLLQLIPVWFDDQRTSGSGLKKSYFEWVKQSSVVVGRTSNILTLDYDDYRRRLDNLSGAEGELKASGRKAIDYSLVFGDEWNLYLKVGTWFDQTVKQFFDEGWDIWLTLTVSSMKGLGRADGSVISRPLKAIEARKGKKTAVLWSLAG